MKDKTRYLLYLLSITILICVSGLSSACFLFDDEEEEVEVDKNATTPNIVIIEVKGNADGSYVPSTEYQEYKVYVAYENRGADGEAYIAVQLIGDTSGGERGFIKLVNFDSGYRDSFWFTFNVRGEPRIRAWVEYEQPFLP